jgi:hypothetical protein
MSMQLENRSAYDYAIQIDPMLPMEDHSIYLKAPQVLPFMKKHYEIRAISEYELVERIKTLYDKIGIPYIYDNFTFHTLFRCGPGRCMFRIYRNEGEFAKNIENGNFVLEHEIFERHLFQHWIYCFVDDILLGRNETTTDQIANYIKDLDMDGFVTIDIN